MSRASERFGQYLPAVYRGEQLDQFLRAFEDLYDEIVTGIEGAPSLLSLTPTPALDRSARQGDRVLWLDTASGIYPGDWLQVCGGSASTEFVRVVDVAAAPITYSQAALAPLVDPANPPVPTPLGLIVDAEIQGLLPPVLVGIESDDPETGLLHDHPARTRVRLVGRVTAESTLAAPVHSGESLLYLDPFHPALPDPGDVLELTAPDGAEGEGELVEVVGLASPHEVMVRPPLGRSYGFGWSVRLRSARPTTTPPPELYPYAERQGPELLLMSAVQPGERVLELDTLEGLAEGDVLLLWDRDPAAVEFVIVEKVFSQEEEDEAATLSTSADEPSSFRRRGLLVSSLVRPPESTSTGTLSAHEAGTFVHVLGKVGAETFLTMDAAPSEQGAPVLSLAEPEKLALKPGHVLRLEGEPAEYALALNVSGPAITLARPLIRAYAPGTRVALVRLMGGGTAHLEQLAQWIGVSLRPGRGERWQREWVRRAAVLWRYRGTRIGIEGLLAAYLRGEAEVTVYDLSNPLQVGMVSTIGVDTAIGGGAPHYYWVDLRPNPNRTSLFHPEGLMRLIRETRSFLLNETPAHTHCDLMIHSAWGAMGVREEPSEDDLGIRVGDTTMIWDNPLLVRIE